MLTHLSSRAIVGALMLSIAAGASAPAQLVRGQVRDEVNHNPLRLVSVALWDGRDSVVTTTTVNDSGRFSLRIPRPGWYSIDLHHIGYVETTTKPFQVAVGDTISLTLEMPSNGVVLDTITSKEASKPQGFFSVTPSIEYVRQHYVLGKGLIISGWSIEKSKKSLSAYLGSLDGLHLSGTYARGTPVIPAEHGQFLMADSRSQCLYARVDRYSLLYMLMQQGAETIDEMLKVKDIMAVEVYRTKAEIPEEWGQFGIVDELFTRNNSGHTYTIGHTGFPSISTAGASAPSTPGQRLQTDATRDLPAAQTSAGVAASSTSASSILTEDALEFGTAPVDPFSSDGHIPACGFLQIWTGAAYRSTGG